MTPLFFPTPPPPYATKTWSLQRTVGTPPNHHVETTTLVGTELDLQEMLRQGWLIIS